MALKWDKNDLFWTTSNFSKNLAASLFSRHIYPTVKILKELSLFKKSEMKEDMCENKWNIQKVDRASQNVAKFYTVVESFSKNSAIF